jgi:hypothetical protein
MCIGAGIGAVVGGLIGAAFAAGPQIIQNYQQRQPLLTNVDPVAVAKAAVVGAVGGAIVGGTFGAVGVGAGLGKLGLSALGAGVQTYMDVKAGFTQDKFSSIATSFATNFVTDLAMSGMGGLLGKVGIKGLSALPGKLLVGTGASMLTEGTSELLYGDNFTKNDPQPVWNSMINAVSGGSEEIFGKLASKALTDPLVPTGRAGRIAKPLIEGGIRLMADQVPKAVKPLSKVMTSAYSWLSTAFMKVTVKSKYER